MAYSNAGSPALKARGIFIFASGSIFFAAVSFIGIMIVCLGHTAHRDAGIGTMGMNRLIVS
eukprot:COSAG02_NODE_1320_length_13269_cov_11.420058_13_plen_61_part_00